MVVHIWKLKRAVKMKSMGQNDLIFLSCCICCFFVFFKDGSGADDHGVAGNAAEFCVKMSCETLDAI